MNNKYDTILIGNNLVIYMAAIYLKTSGQNILVLKRENKKDYEFDGHDMIPGVMQCKDQKDLVYKLEQQCRNLKCLVKDEEIVKIDYTDKMEVRTGNDSVNYSAKCVVLDNSVYNLQCPFVFDTSKGVRYNQAIELCGLGCRLSFAIRDSASK